MILKNIGDVCVLAPSVAAVQTEDGNIMRPVNSDRVVKGCPGRRPLALVFKLSTAEPFMRKAGPNIELETPRLASNMGLPVPLSSAEARTERTGRFNFPQQKGRRTAEPKCKKWLPL